VTEKETIKHPRYIRTHLTYGPGVAECRRLLTKMAEIPPSRGHSLLAHETLLLFPSKTVFPSLEPGWAL
jgi:hypothetical protein